MSNFKLGAYVNNDILYTRHSNAGFFSCCSVKLDNIIQYYNIYKKLPNVRENLAIKNTDMMSL